MVYSSFPARVSGASSACTRSRNKCGIQGFSLIELAISMTIIGLLVAGVLSGQALMNASKLNKISSDMQHFIDITQLFMDKYKALPGDMPNATKYWGDNSTKCADAGIADSTPGTCNGDGNHRIDKSAAAASQEAEVFLYWQHLQLAGLLEAAGTLTGISGPGSVRDAILDENAPSSSYCDECGFHMDFQNSPSGDAYLFPAQAHRMWFGKKATNGVMGDEALSAEDMWNVDNKVDDGLPGKGIIRVWREIAAPDCSTTNGALSAAADADQAVYDFSNSGEVCFFARLIEFY